MEKEISKKAHRNKRQNMAWLKKNFYSIVLILIIIYAVSYSVLTAVGPSNFGDDMAYVGVSLQIINGIFRESTYIYSVRLMQIVPLAFFYWVFGVGALSSAAWNIISFVATVIMVYVIGSELHSKKVGSIAAFLMCFFPLVITYTGTISDDLPLMMFTTLAIMALILARKRSSKKWYIISGLSVVASMLVTPLAIILIPFLVIYLGIDFLRGKLKISKTSMYFIYGILLAAFLLMVFNYLDVGNPLITFALNTNFYSRTATLGHGIILNTTYYTQPGAPGSGTAIAGVWYYVGVIFPYHIINIISTSLKSLKLDPLQIWNNMYQNYNSVGFYFYLFVLCAAYLIFKREKAAYIPLLWFFVMFAYLSAGPEILTLNPFTYVIMIRLDRYLMPIVPSVLIVISMAFVKFVETTKKHSARYLRLSLVIIAAAFLVGTSIPINAYWYNVKFLQSYDLHQIANYVSKLPTNTTIYYVNGLSEFYIYAGAHNISRFMAYDQVSNCTSLHQGAYVVVPKYAEYFNLNYTPNPTAYCPSWELVLYPNLTKNFTSSITGAAQVFRAKLYYIPKNAS